MSPKLTSAKRFVVRTALVTSTTLATLMGAQALASLDASTFVTPTPIVAPANTQLTESTVVQLPVTTTTTAAAPNIVILRHAGDEPITTQVNTQTTRFNPPNPVVVEPVVIQPIIPSTQSSR